MAFRTFLTFFLFAILFVAFSSLFALAVTDSLDLEALHDFYLALKKPDQLKGWMHEGGDPCEEAWTGVECFGSSVIHLKLRGLELNGYLSSRLSSFHSLRILDVSLNRIEGEIPFGLPPNLTHLNLSSNSFSLSIPHSLSYLRNLRHLNVSHNTFSGVIGDIFIGLQNLREMDLSYNKFAGDLPSSFASLTNLTKLFLQNNHFTGSVVYLSNLQLTDLNIQDNNFSGIIPRHFQTIPNLWMGGNKFHVAPDYPPWDFPFEKVPTHPNISGPPTAESSAIEKYPPSNIVTGSRSKGMAPGGIAFVVCGVALLAGIAALAVFVRIKRANDSEIKSFLNDSGRSIRSIAISSRESSPDANEKIPQVVNADKPLVMLARSAPAAHHARKDRFSRRSFSRRYKMPPSAKFYTLADLQLATKNFCKENFLGDGSLGSVYKAEFPDGKIFAVKNINLVSLSLHEEEQFLDVVRFASHLRHPHIVRLVGYCLEHGQHLLVYEFVRNLTLSGTLNSKFFLPLTWGLRIRIAVGVADALRYMHSLSPPVAHCNLKAANILLDDGLLPRVSDCGISMLRPLTSNDVKIKASELAISNSDYIAPEHGESGVENTKSDVYAFGVLLLELLTGKRPFDSSRPIEEQSLVKWASSRLYDGNSLEDIVDPRLRSKSFTSKTLYRYADIIALCVQPEKELRPSMSEVLEALTKLLPKRGSDGAEADAFERSFRSTFTRFPPSPSSYMSA